MKNLYLNTVVFISGAAVLAIEILGTRILGPFYGVSLYLWSSLITVTLAALSTGYFVGGRYADKSADLTKLSKIVFAAGIWLLILPFLKHPLLQITETLGLRFAVLSSAILLFAIPLFFLGMVGPYAIRLKISNINNAGSIAGNVYAISTVASVLSALVTGFFLIPNIGLGKLTAGIGIILLLTASIGITNKVKTNLSIFLVLLLFCLAYTGPWNILDRKNSKQKNKLLKVRQSLYAEIRVVDFGDSRHLLIDGATHTVVDPSNWKSQFQYVPVMDIPKFLYDKPGDILLLGLGGGSIAKNYTKSGWKVDVVEIDQTVSDIAKEYFGLKPEEANIIIADARQYLENHDKKYDLIVVDAYGNGYMPFHLVSSESFGLIKSRLKPRGVVAVNVNCIGWKDKIVNTLAATMKTQFGNIVALPIAEPPNKIGNLVLLAADREIDFSEDLLKRPKNYLYDPYMHWYILQVNHAWDNRFIPDINNTLIITDDLNPIDIMAERINYVARKNLHKYYGSSEGLSW